MDYERADEKPEEESDGFASCVGAIITFLSYLLILCTMPFSLFVCVKQVQEYERAVIFRLGRLHAGGSKGPGKSTADSLKANSVNRELFSGIFFVLPCIESYQKVDLRTM